MMNADIEKEIIRYIRENLKVGVVTSYTGDAHTNNIKVSVTLFLGELIISEDSDVVYIQ